MVAHRRTSAPVERDEDLLRLRPMLSQSIAEPFDSPDHLFEFKWDGVRYMAYRLRSETRLINRKGAEGTQRYPELINALNSLPPHTVLDGEVVAMENGVPSLPRVMMRDQVREDSRIQSMAKRVPVVYIVFDLLVEAGESLLSVPLIERKARLHSLLKPLKNVLIGESIVLPTHGRKLFDEAVRRGIEGVMAKLKVSPYRPGRRTDEWLKIKPVNIGTFDVLGYVADADSDRISALVIGEKREEHIVLRGKVGSGLTEDERAAIYERMVHLPVNRTPLPGGPRGAQWRDSNLRCEVRYFEVTSEGKLRAPVFQRFV